MKDEIAVDLDGTLAEYYGWKGEEHIGTAIPEMLLRVFAWLEEGKKVTIFTARADSDSAISHVREWLDNHDLGECEITNIKRKSFRLIYDDRAVEVLTNKGVVMEDFQNGKD